jgi:diaminohydroxyphosphoribosylaminopyrimidine deaminase/5-amino-6-(5-phosphoribosylamino)uracil reductase
MKYAMTMDGKIATVNNESKWITGELSRKRVHEERSIYSAIMIGVQTAIIDDPSLTSRIDNAKQPIRIICDTNLRLPISSKIVQTAKDYPTIIATTCKDVAKHDKYLHCEVIVVSEKDKRVDLNELMYILGERKIDSVILEGGATLNWSAIQSRIVNKVQTYIAPKLLGGKVAISPIAGHGIESLDRAIKLIDTNIITLGEDILIESRVVYPCSQA